MNEQVLLAAFMVVLFLVLLGGGLWIFASMLAVGALALIVGTDIPFIRLAARIAFNSTTTQELLALPLYILMAEILFRSRVPQNLFDGLAPWTRPVPGRLVHVNVLACTFFAAVCGSSAATAVTVGKITLPQLFRRKYQRSVSIGSLAGAGTLGFLIPPSLIMIVYGIMSQTSILKLFAAGIVPGIGLAACYMLVIALLSLRDRDIGEQERYVPSDYLRAIGHLLPVLTLIVLILGSMYAGIASPTEAAVVGVAVAILIVAMQGKLNHRMLLSALMGTARTSSMMGMLIVGGTFISVSLGYVGVPQLVAGHIAGMQLDRFALIMVLLLAYIILGMFLDGVSMLVMTLPIVMPLVLQAGLDKVWFGVFLVLVVELAQISPPVGFNLFVLQGLTGEPIWSIARYATPFFVTTTLYTVLITAFPGFVLWLPSILMP